ncbi:MAG: LamB/YcsF family protein [Candidatus Rokuibacteriota bacterium]|nr:MAG: LamB/YcsF family protein [Candidatus Rokubacteria bacterium]PYN54247.1 MAG: LamB/YcsF family protein [Candidatus Rokubacteria bacterium]
MGVKIDINADMGESYGRWTLGNDVELMPFLSSANVACGYHGGDPHVMRNTVRLARKHGVGLGAHVSFPDLIGFGRRRMDISAQELKDYVTYQVGALQAFATAEGSRVEHVKPHGMLYVMCSRDDTYATAMAETIKELDGGLILLLTGELWAAAARRVGVPFVMEGYVDLDYDAAGQLILERAKKPRDPEGVASRAVALATEGRVPVRDGGWLPLAARSICVHGDADNAPAIARAMRERLVKAGVDVAPLRALL